MTPDSLLLLQCFRISISALGIHFKKLTAVKKKYDLIDLFRMIQKFMPIGMFISDFLCSLHLGCIRFPGADEQIPYLAGIQKPV